LTAQRAGETVTITRRLRKDASMESVRERRTLVVANRTAATPLLLDEIRRRAVKQPTTFVLLRPTVSSKSAHDWTLEEAVKALRKAASGPTRQLTVHVEGGDGGPDAFEAVKEALADGGFDDVIVSTLSKRTSEWLRRDLPRRIEALDVPVTVITQPSGKRRPTNEAMLWNVDHNPVPEETE
jgi:hypothetical protein